MYRPDAPFTKTSFRKLLGDNHLWTTSMVDLMNVIIEVVKTAERGCSVLDKQEMDRFSVSQILQPLKMNLVQIERITSAPLNINAFITKNGRHSLMVNTPSVRERFARDFNAACQPLSHFSNQNIFRNWVDTSRGKPRVITDINKAIAEKQFSVIKNIHFGKVKTIFETLYSHYFLESQFSRHSRSLSQHVMGYRAGIDQLNHARYHINSKTLITIDIKSFFDTICMKDMVMKNQLLKVLHTSFELQTGYPFVPETFKYQYMYEFLVDYYSMINVAWLTLMQFFTYNGGLPTGAPYSPVFSNIILAPIDNWISNTFLPSKNDVVYTRFADDMAFSTTAGIVNGKFNLSIEDCKAIEAQLNDYGFKLNYDKTKIMPPGKCKTVYGLVIDQSNPSDPRLTVGRDRKRELMTILANTPMEELDDSTRGTMAWIQSVNEQYFNDLINASQQHLRSGSDAS